MTLMTGLAGVQLLSPGDYVAVRDVDLTLVLKVVFVCEDALDGVDEHGDLVSLPWSQVVGFHRRPR